MSELAELVRTATAFPSQWEGRTTTGQMVYVRYRHGFLSWGFGPTIDAALDASEHNVIEHGTGGEMTEAEMLQLTGMSLAPGCSVSHGDGISLSGG